MRKDNKKVQSDGAGGWFGYIRCDFDKDHRERFNQAYTAVVETQAMEWLIDMVGLFYRMSIGYDVKGKSYMASMTGLEGAPLAARGWTLTARAHTPEKAVTALWYKHTVILNEDWSDHAYVRDDQGEDEQWVR